MGTYRDSDLRPNRYGPQRITVRETIRHGDYHNVREARIEPTWNGFTDFLSGSPYHAGKTNNNWNDHNRYVARLFADLLTKGSGDYGWADYRVIPADATEQTRGAR